jgi:hypothetical protein
MTKQAAGQSAASDRMGGSGYPPPTVQWNWPSFTPAQLLGWEQKHKNVNQPAGALSLPASGAIMSPLNVYSYPFRRSKPVSGACFSLDADKVKTLLSVLNTGLKLLKQKTGKIIFFDAREIESTEN